MEKFKELFFKKRSKKFWLVFGSILLVILLLSLFVLRPLLKKGKSAEITVGKVTRGNIIRTIEGSGQIKANDERTISSLVTGEILSDTFNVGDMVEKDALLYVIDSTNMDYNLKRAESSMESARLSYEEAMEMQKNQTVKAPIDGVITNLYIKEGDEITNGTRVADIIDASHMLLSIRFLASDAAHISVGASAEVVPENAPGETLWGTVKSVGSGSFTNSFGVAVTNVEIWVDNPGGLIENSRATAKIGAYACNEIGTFSYGDMETVTVKTGGTVENLRVHAGDSVNKNNTLFTLYSASTERSLERSRLSYNDAVSSRDNTFEQLDDYQIKSPISGKVIQKNVKAGDKLESGAGSSASSMAIIADLSVLTFDMSVDEMDIGSMEKGQEVRVTVDAFPNKVFMGHVDNITIKGTSTNGVTSYPVTVKLDGEENTELLPDMNVNATIIIESKQNVLVIPSSAVQRGNLVAVKGSAPSTSASAETSSPTGESAASRAQDKAANRASSMEAPEGFHYVRIETGITDGSFIEVISGLSEGDEILLTASQGDKNSPVNYTQNAPQGMMGGMSGGMPMGSGMPMGGSRMSR